jgi:hypothetical protein
MSDRRNDSAGARFYVTFKGLDALELADTCGCVLVIDDGYVQCRDCGTVYTSLRQIARWTREINGLTVKRARD